MKTKRVFAIVLSVLLVLNAVALGIAVSAASAPAGEGSEQTPYLITSADDLTWLASESQTNIFSGKYFRLTADIDLGGKAFSPIGCNDSKFAGNFDGAGHTISNFTVTGGHAALFAYVKDGSIKNLTVAKATISTSDSSCNAAGIAANANAETLTNLTVASDVTVTGYWAGGVIGRVDAVCKISYCTNNATVSTTTHIYAGGIAALITGASKVSYCVNNGQISASGSGAPAAGGITGRFSTAAFDHCLNTGKVTSNTFAGGLAAQAYDGATGSWVDCVNTSAEITGAGSWGTGLVSQIKGNITVTNCISRVADGLPAIYTEDVNATHLEGITGTVECNGTDNLDAMNNAANAITSAVASYVEPSSEPGTGTESSSEEATTEKDLPTGWEDADIAKTFESGTGVYNDPFVIKTPAQLALLAKNVNNGTAYEGTYFVLGADIDLAGKTWVPIGVTDKNFQGNFNGKGFSVKNMTVSLTEGNGESVLNGGLFGFILNATVKNVNIVAANVTVGGVRNYAAGVVAVAQGSTVSACKVDAASKITYTAPAESGNVVAGGIVGCAKSGKNEKDPASLVTNCVNEATVLGSKGSAAVFVGGVVGLMGKASVTYCVNKGAVTADGGTGYYDAGGVVGRMGLDSQTGTVDHCVNYADVVSSQHGGGVVGVINAALCNVTNSFSCGRVKGNMDWSGLGLGRWNAFLCTLTGSGYLERQPDTETGDTAIRWTDRGMGVFDPAKETGSRGLTVDDFVGMDEQTITPLMNNIVSAVDQAIAASVAAAETDPNAKPEESTTGSEKATEAKTESNTTKESATTAAEIDSLTETSGEEATTGAGSEKSGCGSLLGGGAILLVAACTAFAIKKKHD